MNRDWNKPMWDEAFKCINSKTVPVKVSRFQISSVSSDIPQLILSNLNSLTIWLTSTDFYCHLVVWVRLELRKATLIKFQLPRKIATSYLQWNKKSDSVEFFPTFIDKSCVSFSYLKKKKKSPPSLKCHKAQNYAVSKSIVWIKNFVQYNDQSLKNKKKTC